MLKEMRRGYNEDGSVLVHPTLYSDNRHYDGKRRILSYLF